MYSSIIYTHSLFTFGGCFRPTPCSSPPPPPPKISLWTEIVYPKSNRSLNVPIRTFIYNFMPIYIIMTAQLYANIFSVECWLIVLIIYLPMWYSCMQCKWWISVYYFFILFAASLWIHNILSLCLEYNRSQDLVFKWVLYNTIYCVNRVDSALYIGIMCILVIYIYINIYISTVNLVSKPFFHITSVFTWLLNRENVTNIMY